MSLCRAIFGLVYSEVRERGHIFGPRLFIDTNNRVNYVRTESFPQSIFSHSKKKASYNSNF